MNSTLVSDSINQVVRGIDRMIEGQGSKKHFFSASSWFQFYPISLYARIQLRACDGVGMKVLTIASIEIDERWQNRGVFKELLVNLTELARLRECGAVLVESVINPNLKAYLLKNDFKPASSSEGPISQSLFKSVNI